MQDAIDIEVTPLSAACGAEIKGVDLTGPLDAATVGAIKDAWGRHLNSLLNSLVLPRLSENPKSLC